MLKGFILSYFFWNFIILILLILDEWKDIDETVDWKHACFKILLFILWGLPLTINEAIKGDR